MTRPSALSRRLLAALAAVAITAAGLAPTGAASAAPDHTTVVKPVPSTASPDIMDGTVYAIHDAGTKIIAAGSFTRVQNRGSDVDITRNYVLAFDKATGTVDTAFAPTVDNQVYAVVAGPTAGTVFLAGKFNTVNGVTRRKVALLNVATGAVVTSFAGPAFNGLVNDVALVGNRLLVGGIFTTAGNTNPRGGLASLSASTGALDSYLTTTLTEHHNYDGVSGANAGVGAGKLAVSPDGRQLVVIGNFKQADGVLHDQIVKLDLGAGAATIADWNTSRYTPRCAWWAFDTYMRDVAYAPDGSYFVVVTTGAPNAGTLCDSAARWETDATGTELQPTWADYSGGDTFLSVGISEQAVYVGGHIRWLNNSFGGDSAQAGAVGRASIAALDPRNGLPMSWNPGRHPRGVGVSELLVTPAGLWLGSDTSWIGNFQYRRERIAFFPLTGGAAPHPTTTAGLPGKVYRAGVPVPTNVLYRVNAGGPLVAATDSGPDWAADDAADPSPYHNDGSSTAGFGPVGSVDATVPAGTPSALYSDERWDSGGDPEMQWQLPVPAGTEIEVRLYLADRYDGTSTPGSRVFDVALDGVTVLDDLDLSGTVGHNVGTMRSFAIVSDGSVDLDFGHVVENPLVDGIEIVKTGPPPAGNGEEVQVRSYDGASAVGASSVLANPDNTAWSTARGGFWVGGTLFYGMNGALYRRSFDGTTFGTPSLVDPYHDAYWDTVETDSGPDGQTYAGVTTNFYAEIPNVTGMFYTAGRLYYTLAGQGELHWRWFTPDSGVVGADRFTVAGVTGFADAGGIFLGGDTLYKVDRSTGDLSSTDWAGGAPTGAFTVRSGPAADGNDWRARAVFVGP
ncbi:Di-glucose binding within endoplasmic reticulum [Micromonospora rhizosphaerae]|uniref:Di-glucose binding within endoplasmic reticulum n=1 Tax=Micromonospora rhizosphaerae TaxID=568872 RepID=A0A1C6RYP3_9ACTN|nr:malectin domain-containing carbohydrate-binding protein [Micromonospora rhizosphaerae]SCL22205.1 Di-glucose binding within endoplasmic reticulum [Micromonospora rhizosphaerae]